MQVLRAQKHLTDRLQQEKIDKQRDDLKGLVDSTREEIDSLHRSQADLQKTKSELEAKRDYLLQELNRVNQDIDAVDSDLSRIQPDIKKLEGECNTLPRGQSAWGGGRSAMALFHLLRDRGSSVAATCRPLSSPGPPRMPH